MGIKRCGDLQGDLLRNRSGPDRQAIKVGEYGVGGKTVHRRKRVAANTRRQREGAAVAEGNSNRIAYKDVVKGTVAPFRSVFTAARISMPGRKQQEP